MREHLVKQPTYHPNCLSARPPVDETPPYGSVSSLRMSLGAFWLCFADGYSRTDSDTTGRRFQHTGHHRKRLPFLIIIISFCFYFPPPYTKPWISALGGTVVETAKTPRFFFFFSFPPLLLAFVPAVFSPRSAPHLTFHTSLRAVERRQAVPALSGAPKRKGPRLEMADADDAVPLHPSLKCISSAWLLLSFIFSRFVWPPFVLFLCSFLFSTKILKVQQGLKKEYQPN